MEELEKKKQTQEKIIKLNKLLSNGLIDKTEFDKKVLELKGRTTINENNRKNNTRFKITKRNNLFGYVDDKNEDFVIIEHKFEDAFPFNEGIAAVIYHNRRGYINVVGEFVVPPIYDKAGTFFNNGKATVYLNGEELIINKRGEITTASDKL